MIDSVCILLARLSGLHEERHQSSRGRPSEKIRDPRTRTWNGGSTHKACPLLCVIFGKQSFDFSDECQFRVEFVYLH